MFAVVHAKELDCFPVEEEDTISDLNSLEPDAVGYKLGAGEGNDQVVKVRGFGGPFVGVGDGNCEGSCSGGS